MKTLEMALKAETRKQQWLRIKLFADVWIQVSLYAFILILAFIGNFEHAAAVHIFILNLFQFFNNGIHPNNPSFQKQRSRFNNWVIVNILAILPSLVSAGFLGLLMISNALLALYYLTISIREFYITRK